MLVLFNLDVNFRNIRLLPSGSPPHDTTRKFRRLRPKPHDTSEQPHQTPDQTLDKLQYIQSIPEPYSHCLARADKRRSALQHAPPTCRPRAQVSSHRHLPSGHAAIASATLQTTRERLSLVAVPDRPSARSSARLIARSLEGSPKLACWRACSSSRPLEQQHARWCSPPPISCSPSTRRQVAYCYSSLTSPHLTTPHLTSPHLTLLHLTSPHAPHHTSLRLCLRNFMKSEMRGVK